MQVKGPIRGADIYYSGSFVASTGSKLFIIVDADINFRVGAFLAERLEYPCCCDHKRYKPSAANRKQKNQNLPPTSDLGATLILESAVFTARRT